MAGANCVNYKVLSEIQIIQRRFDMHDDRNNYTIRAPGWVRRLSTDS